MGIFQRIKKMIPGRTITYVRKGSGLPKRKMPKAPNYKIPKTPRVSGRGWGP